MTSRGAPVKSRREPTVPESLAADRRVERSLEMTVRDTDKRPILRLIPAYKCHLSILQVFYHTETCEG